MNRQANPITDERRIVEPPSPTETPEYRMMRAAEETIRRAVRDAVLEATYASGPYHEQLGALEDALMGVLCRRDLGWALAYLAGVQMAPELLRQFADRAGQTRDGQRLPGAGAGAGAQAPPTNPPDAGGG